MCLVSCEHAVSVEVELKATWLYAGPIPQAVSSASTAISMAATPQIGTDPRISIQPFGTPGQRNFVGSYGSHHFAHVIDKSWSQEGS